MILQKGQASYLLSVKFQHIETVRIVQPETNSEYLLAPQHKNSFEELRSRNPDPGRPRFYYINGHTIEFCPTPDWEYEAKVRYVPLMQEI